MRITLLTTACLSCCVLTATLMSAEPAAADRFTDAATKLITAINADDQPAIQQMFTDAMQQALPSEKSGPFFRGLVTAKGKLQAPGAPEISGPAAKIRVAAERGAWKFEITLDGADKIAGLRILPGDDKPAPQEADPAAAAQRYTDATTKLIAAINADDQAAIQQMFDEAVQKALPAEKAGPFFRGVLAAKGKLQTAGAPEVSGPAAKIRVTAERGAWQFEMALDSSGKISGLQITQPAADQSVSVPRSQTSMRLPFHGQWHVFWGGDNEQVNAHASVPNQRRAADLIVSDASGQSHQGDGRKNEDYYAYGKEILAAAPGTVLTAVDGVPDNTPGSMNSFIAVGNCLIIDQGRNEYAVYCHLQPGSLRVHKADKVKAGQVLGLCGNSGNSSEPHLHFHLQDSAVLQDGLGITPYFTGVKCERDGKPLTGKPYTFLKGDNIQPAGEK